MERVLKYVSLNVKLVSNSQLYECLPYCFMYEGFMNMNRKRIEL